MANDNIMLNCGQVSATIQTITPREAEMMLARNTINRRLDPKRAREMARDMRNGNWKLNGDAIRFSRTGELLDGQHRLTACVLSGQPFTTLVIRNLEADTQLTMDTGKKRTMADALTLHGETNPVLLASVVKAVYVTHMLGLEAYVSTSLRPTNLELDGFLKETPQLRVIAQAAQAFRSQSKGLLSPGMFAALWWTFAHKDNTAAEEFFGKLASGAGLTENDPILVLRNTLYGHRNSVQSNTASGRRTILAITVKAWNKWRAGETVKMLRFSSEERFPEAR